MYPPFGLSTCGSDSKGTYFDHISDDFFTGVATRSSTGGCGSKGNAAFHMKKMFPFRSAYVKFEVGRARIFIAVFHSLSDFARIICRNCSPPRTSPSPANFMM